MRIYRETDVTPPRLLGYSSSDSLPDGAAYWNDVRGTAYFVPEMCICDMPVIGRADTSNRWTCRTCSKKVQKRDCEVQGGDDED